VAAVDSVAAVAVPVESAIVGKRLTLTETPKGLSGPVLPICSSLALGGAGRSFSRKLDDEVRQIGH
jgi:hypothetical protein